MPKKQKRASVSVRLALAEYIVAFISSIATTGIYGVTMTFNLLVGLSSYVIGAVLTFAIIFAVVKDDTRFYALLPLLSIVTLTFPMVTVPVKSVIVVNPGTLVQINVASILVASIVSIFVGYPLFSKTSKTITQVSQSLFILVILLAITLPLISLETISYGGVQFAVGFTNVAILVIYLLFIFVVIELRSKEEILGTKDRSV